MQELLENSFESRTGTDEAGRLRRPIAVAIVGCFVSFAVGVLTLSSSNAGDATPIAFLATFAVGSLLSITYAIVGARVSKDAAGRIIAIVGPLIALAGVIYIIYLLKTGPNA